jgi:hypothetical protein
MTLSNTLQRHKPPPTLRLAYRIHDTLTERQRKADGALLYPLERLTVSLEQLAAQRRRLALVQQKGWYHAQDQVLREIQFLLAGLPPEIARIQHALPTPRVPLSIANLAREFDQLQEEFGGWEYEHPAFLSVVTEPITLEEIPLGAFRIRLHLDRLRTSHGSTPYEVLALQPNPAQCNEAVTHPHVRDHELCEGDAAVALQAALAEGRLCDFFLLVRSVLQTYNRDSPFVALSSWHGFACHDCDFVMSEGESNYCEGCDHDFCESCISYCRCCDATRCMNCLETCPHCGHSTCSSCLDACAECGKPCCQDCLEEECCPACAEKKKGQNQPPATPPDPASPPTASNPASPSSPVDPPDPLPSESEDTFHDDDLAPQPAGDSAPLSIGRGSAARIGAAAGPAGHTGPDAASLVTAGPATVRSRQRSRRRSARARRRPRPRARTRRTAQAA